MYIPPVRIQVIACFSCRDRPGHSIIGKLTLAALACGMDILKRGNRCGPTDGSHNRFINRNAIRQLLHDLFKRQWHRTNGHRFFNPDAAADIRTDHSSGNCRYIAADNHRRRILIPFFHQHSRLNHLSGNGGREHIGARTILNGADAVAADLITGHLLFDRYYGSLLQCSSRPHKVPVQKRCRIRCAVHRNRNHT